MWFLEHIFSFILTRQIPYVEIYKTTIHRKVMIMEADASNLSTAITIGTKEMDHVRVGLDILPGSRITVHMSFWLLKQENLMEVLIQIRTNIG